MTQFQRVNPVVMLGEEKTMRVEDQYTDVLQNIEFGIVMTYRSHPEMSDYDVIRMLEALIDKYATEKIGRQPRHVLLSEVERALLENVHRMCNPDHGDVCIDFMKTSEWIKFPTNFS